MKKSILLALCAATLSPAQATDVSYYVYKFSADDNPSFVRDKAGDACRG